MKILLCPGLPLFVAIAALASGCGGSSNGAASVSSASSVAVIGDVPYGTRATDTSQFQANPAFIAGINNDADVSLVMHVGDIHSGKEYCSETYDLGVFNQWKAFKNPLEYLKLTIDPAINAANGTDAFGPFSWKRVKS